MMKEIEDLEMLARKETEHFNHEELKEHEKLHVETRKRLLEEYKRNRQTVDEEHKRVVKLDYEKLKGLKTRISDLTAQEYDNLKKHHAFS
jgi:hypothetical protein